MVRGPAIATHAVRGEEFSFSYNVIGSDGSTPLGYNISVYLGETFVSTIEIGALGIINASTIIPTSWAESSGYFTIRIDFIASGYYEGSSAETTVMLHVFIDAVFTSPYPTQVLLNVPFVINGTLQDDQGNAIIGREVEMILQNESRTVILTTDENGAYELAIEQGIPEGSRYTYTVTFRDDDGDIIVRENYTILIQTGLGFDIVLIMIWAAVIVIEIVIAGLLINRFRKSRGGFRRFKSTSSITKTTSDYVSISR